MIKNRSWFLHLQATIFTLTTLLVMSLSVSGQTTVEKKILDDLSSYYEKALTDWEVPGMAIALVKDGNIIFSEGLG